MPKRQRVPLPRRAPCPNSSFLTPDALLSQIQRNMSWPTKSPITRSVSYTGHPMRTSPQLSFHNSLFSAKSSSTYFILTNQVTHHKVRIVHRTSHAHLALTLLPQLLIFCQVKFNTYYLDKPCHLLQSLYCTPYAHLATTLLSQLLIICQVWFNIFCPPSTNNTINRSHYQVHMFLGPLLTRRVRFLP